MSSNISLAATCAHRMTGGISIPFQAARRSLRCCWKTLAVASAALAASAAGLPLASMGCDGCRLWDQSSRFEGLDPDFNSRLSRPQEDLPGEWDLKFWG